MSAVANLFNPVFPGHRLKFKESDKPLMLTYPGYESLDFSVFIAKEEIVIVDAPEEEEVKRKQSKWEHIIDTVKKTAEKLPGL